MASTGTIATIVLSSLLLAGCSRRPEPEPKPESKQARRDANVLLVTIDTLRADYLSCYGSPGDLHSEYRPPGRPRSPFRPSVRPGAAYRPFPCVDSDRHLSEDPQSPGYGRLRPRCPSTDASHDPGPGGPADRGFHRSGGPRPFLRFEPRLLNLRRRDEK